jgi:hypothetical protein
MRAPDVRATVWRGIRNIALGLAQIHEQQMLHTALTTTSILVDPASGPESMRLGGFEWTVRVGHVPVAQAASPAGENVPATLRTFESDW